MSERTKIGTKTGKMPIAAAMLVCFALALCACGEGKTQIPPPDSLTKGTGIWIFEGDNGKQTFRFTSATSGTLVSTMDIYGDKIPKATYTFTYKYKKPAATLTWVTSSLTTATEKEIADHLPSTFVAQPTFEKKGKLLWSSNYFYLQ
ncbi:MAG: hypothetical protein Ta2A_08400 [Treponemataceae bacterium]|nr:MAG: hypothetical protein Ta2A_08400 [Treponemataceae bacterium]